jgi:hypothetical protein
MAHTDPATLVPKLVITLEDDRAEFLAFAKPNQWALMQNAEATKNGTNGEALASVYKLATTSVLPSDRDRFNAFMMDHGQDDDLEDKLTEALFALWEGATMLPLEPTSSDSSGSTGANDSTSTEGSSEPESSRPFPVKSSIPEPGPEYRESMRVPIPDPEPENMENPDPDPIGENPGPLSYPTRLITVNGSSIPV